MFDVFDALFNLKRYYLLFESEYGRKEAEQIADSFLKKNPVPESAAEIALDSALLMSVLEKLMSEAMLERLPEYIEYSKKYYDVHWSKVPNPKIVQMYFNRCKKVLNLEKSENKKFALACIDLGGQLLWFSSKNDLIQYANKTTALFLPFVKMENGKLYAL